MDVSCFAIQHSASTGRFALKTSVRRRRSIGFKYQCTNVHAHLVGDSVRLTTPLLHSAATKCRLSRIKQPSAGNARPCFVALAVDARGMKKCRFVFSKTAK